jgi:PBP1b-binding outer membrane lipoprotein LpoB
MKKRQFILWFSFLLSGCMSSESNTESTATPTKPRQPTIKDTDGDGVIDSEDYAPRDPEVQEKSDVTQPTTRPPPQNERVKEADDPFPSSN